MFKKIHHWALHVTDVAAAAKFYSEVLDFRQLSDDATAIGHANVFVQLGDGLLELSHRDQAEAMSGFHICLQPNDFDAAFAKLQASGLPVLTSARPVTPRGPHEAGYRRAVFGGPHGELIEIKG